MASSPKRFARVIMDRWFKRTFGTENHQRLLHLFLQELLPEHHIVKLTLDNTEHVNPFDEKKDKYKEEIFKLLFDYADIATFSPEERIQYELDMTTEADRINQLKYAMEKGREEGAKNQAWETARALLDLDVDEDIIVKSTGLSPEEVRSLK